MNQSNSRFSPVRGISIVIPCAGRVELIGNLLDSIQQAKPLFQHPLEILLLDNSPLKDQELIKTLARKNGAIFVAGSTNLSEKRNQGAYLATHELVLFLDSDCTVDPKILHEHFKTFESGRTAGCLGNLIFTGQDTYTWKSVELTGVLDCFNIAERQQSVMWGPTANISFHRDAFLAVGGFDTSFSKPGGEDVDLGFRLHKSGFQILCNPQAIAFHTKETWSTFSQVTDRFLRYGSADALLIKKHHCHSLFDFPMVSQFGVLLIFFSLLWAFLGSIVNILTPLTWLALTMVIHTTIGTIKSENKKTTWHIHTKQLILLTALDFGRLIGAFRHREPSALYKRIIFYDTQIASEWTGVIQSSWIFLLALFLALIINSVLASF